MICACEAIALKEICEIQREEARKKEYETRKKIILEVWEPFLEKAIIKSAKDGNLITALNFQYEKNGYVQEMRSLERSRYADKRTEYLPKNIPPIPFDAQIIKDFLKTNCFEVDYFKRDFYFYGCGCTSGFAMLITARPECI